MGKFVEEMRTKVFVRFKIKNGFFRAKKEFFSRFEGKIRVGGFYGF